MIFRIGAMIDEIFTSNIPSINRSFSGNAESAFRLIDNKIANRGIGIVQGPPGTGKTTIYEEVIRDRLINNKLDKKEILVYITPTNQLAYDMIKKMTNVFRANGLNRSDIKRYIRLYGSKFDYGQYTQLNKSIDNDVRLVITTEYQRVFSRDRNYHLLIDEASKSPLHRPFLPLTDNLTDSLTDNIIASISVIGDPKQAIALNEQYREEGSRLLIMNILLRGLLKMHNEFKEDVDITKLARDSSIIRGKYYEFLDITMRLPEPSEKPISMGYYDGKLKSGRPSSVLNSLYDSNIARQLEADLDKFKDIVKVIEKALTTCTPLIYAEIDPFPTTDDVLWHKKRGELSLLFAIALAKITRKDTAIITPYTDQKTQTKLLYDSSYQRFLAESVKIDIKTAQQMLGSEAANIICVLGKEYWGGKDMPTIYFQEPELLNVQLSRHKYTLVIIGNLKRLRNSAAKADQELRSTRYKEIIDTIDTILNEECPYVKYP